VNKSEIVDRLEAIATLLELQGDNPFKIRAYAQGARALEALETPLDVLIAEDRLASVRGIGSALADKITTLHQSGELPFYDQLKAKVAPGLLEMLEIPGLGAKKVRALNKELGLDSIAALQAAAEAGSIAALKGFGAKSEAKILQGIRNREAYSARHLRWNVIPVIENILSGLRSLEAVQQAEAAGSFRRGLETVGDLDFIVASNDPDSVMDWFVKQPHVSEITARGQTKSSVRLEDGLQADIRVVPAAQFAFALHHFTGSKEHNVALRQRALQRGLSLSEWGFERRGDSDGTLPQNIDNESALFAALGLANIPAELREGYDELKLAEADALPDLVKTSDIRGVFHNHTSASDGNDSLEAMAEGAAARGWEYIGIADHSKSSRQAHGLDDARLLRQVDAIATYNDRTDAACHIFSGCECDILPDGSLDLADSTLARLDYVVIAVHSAFSQTREEMTQRILRAMEHPAVTMLAHPTGRLLLRREPYAVDLEAIIEKALAKNIVIEINANPKRLDMDWRWWRNAAKRGLLTSINPDAHRVEQLDYVAAGILAARKGGLPAGSVLNTRSLAQVKTWLEQRRSFA
jgi:DNA polymerase (family 10)